MKPAGSSTVYHAIPKEHYELSVQTYRDVFEVGRPSNWQRVIASIAPASLGSKSIRQALQATDLFRKLKDRMRLTVGPVNLTQPIVVRQVALKDRNVTQGSGGQPIPLPRVPSTSSSSGGAQQPPDVDTKHLKNTLPEQVTVSGLVSVVVAAVGPAPKSTPISVDELVESHVHVKDALALERAWQATKKLNETPEPTAFQRGVAAVFGNTRFKDQGGIKAAIDACRKYSEAYDAAKKAWDGTSLDSSAFQRSSFPEPARDFEALAVPGYPTDANRLVEPPASQAGVSQEKLDQLASQLRDAQRGIDDRDAEIRRLKAEVDRLENARKSVARTLGSELATMSKQNSDLSQRLSEAQSQLARLTQALQAEKEQANNLAKALEAAQQALAQEGSKAVTEMGRLGRESRQLLAQVQRGELLNARAQEQLAKLRDELNTQQSKSAKDAQTLQKLESENASLRQQVKDSQHPALSIREGDDDSSQLNRDYLASRRGVNDPGFAAYKTKTEEALKQLKSENEALQRRLEIAQQAERDARNIAHKAEVSRRGPAVELAQERLNLVQQQENVAHLEWTVKDLNGKVAAQVKENRRLREKQADLAQKNIELGNSLQLVKHQSAEQVLEVSQLRKEKQDLSYELTNTQERLELAERRLVAAKPRLNRVETKSNERREVGEFQAAIIEKLDQDLVETNQSLAGRVEELEKLRLKAENQRQEATRSRQLLEGVADLVETAVGEGQRYISVEALLAMLSAISPDAVPRQVADQSDEDGRA